MGRTIAGVLLVAALVTLSAPAQAGGYATVHLDQPPSEVVAGRMWQFGFMVLQHDVTPNSDVTPIVTARHKETGEAVTATGRQEGPVGHFVAEITFPRAGAWKWSIRPEPYAETSFETLTVLDHPQGMASHPAAIRSGACTRPGEIAYPLADVESQPPMRDPKALPVAVGSATIDAALPALAARGLVISVARSETDATVIVCAVIPGTATDDDLVLGLDGWNDSGAAGVAVLHPDGEQTSATLYLLTLDRQQAAPEAAADARVEIVDAGDDWTFQPAALTVPPGTTVTWTNDTAMSHTITGDDLAFDDSGPIAAGQSYSQTFTKPGTYRYRCGPHPWMEGTILVQ